MSNVDRCVCCGREIPEGSQVCVICGQKPKQKERQIDRIRNMSVEELAEFMNKCGWDFPPYCDYQKATRGICDQNCLKCAKEYLESEVDTDDR